MAQPVKLSEFIVLDARQTAKIAERSIAGQLEYWTGLGRAVERILRTGEALALKQRGEVAPLSALLDLENEAQRRAFREKSAEQLASRPFPHFEPAPEGKGLLVRIDQDGTRTLGRFLRREFQPVKASPHRGSSDDAP